MRVTGVSLVTTRLAEMRAFYTGVLQLPVVAESPDSVSVQVGSTVLTFHRSRVPPFYHVAFGCTAGAFSNLQARVQAAVGLLPDSSGQLLMYSTAWRCPQIYFEDPEGNILELLCPDDDASDGGSPWLRVLEVGVPVPDLAAVRSHLSGVIPTGAPGASAQFQQLLHGPSETFQFHGDHDGVFVLVRTGRPWFPTDRPATMPPLSVEVEGAAPEELTFDDVPGLTIRVRPPTA